MRHQLGLFFKLIGISFRSQMQHRASFFMLVSAYFLSTFVDILGVWALFDRFKQVQGWSLEDVAILYGVMHVGFSIPEIFARGFDNFGVIMKMGDFDRMLLRPLGTLLQLASREIHWMRFGRFLQGSLILFWGYFQQHEPQHLAILILVILGIAALFYGLFIIQATLTFWTTETLELMNITTFGGLEAGQYPMSIYKPLLRGFFTFVIPLAFVAYYPIASLFHHESLPYWLATLAPLVGFVFLYFSSQLWNLGVRHYHSTGN